MLDSVELKRRIAAARTLRGLRQIDLQETLTAEGLGNTELGRIERGELKLTGVRRRALSDALRVPERWFVSPDVDEIVGFTVSAQPAADAPPAPTGDLDRELGDDPPSDESHEQTEPGQEGDARSDSE